MKRGVARLMHRFAWWLDQRADDLWDIDEFIDRQLTGPPGGCWLQPELTAKDIYQALEGTDDE